MLPVAVLSTRSGRSWVLLTMKLITAGLLLLALGVVALSAHREMVPVDAPPVTSVMTSSAPVAEHGDAIAASVVGDSSAMLTGVCAFLAVCCVLLISVVFTMRRMGTARTVLAMAPRGSPARAVPRVTFFFRLSLSQLSISRT